jgi:hypothetical protein
VEQWSKLPPISDLDRLGHLEVAEQERLEKTD